MLISQVLNTVLAIFPQKKVVLATKMGWCNDDIHVWFTIEYTVLILFGGYMSDFTTDVYNSWSSIEKFFMLFLF